MNPEGKSGPGNRKDSFERYVVNLMNNFNGISAYWNDLAFASEGAFVTYLRDRRMADLGSGYDRLALDAVLRGLNTDVVSINPDRANPDFRERRMRIITNCMGNDYPHNTVEEMERALTQVDRRAIAAYAHDLSVIPNADVDAVFDIRAVFHYSYPGYRDIYEQSLLEMLRITKSGGYIFIGDRCNIEPGKTPWYQEIFDQLNLNYVYLRRKVYRWEGDEARYRQSGRKQRVGVRVQV